MRIKARAAYWWWALRFLFAPSTLLLPALVLYLGFDGTPHFFLHTLTGWDVGLVVLVGMTYLGRSWSTWDGWLPLALALYALTPDFIYAAGPAHRDWMDVFLFHPGLDEILPFALPVLALLWLLLLISYGRFRYKY